MGAHGGKKRPCHFFPSKKSKKLFRVLFVPYFFLAISESPFFSLFRNIICLFEKVRSKLGPIWKKRRASWKKKGERSAEKTAKMTFFALFFLILINFPSENSSSMF